MGLGSRAGPRGSGLCNHKGGDAFSEQGPLSLSHLPPDRKGHSHGTGENTILSLVKTGRETSFRTTGIGVKTMGMGRAIRLKSPHNKDSWGLRDREHGEGAN